MEDFDYEQCQLLYFDGDTTHPPTNSLRSEAVSSLAPIPFSLTTCPSRVTVTLKVAIPRHLSIASGCMPRELSCMHH